MPSVIVHLQNEEPVLGEVDDLPSPSDQLVIIKNPRKKDGKDLHYVEMNVAIVVWPIHRINFIEILPTAGEEEIITFVRE